MVDSVRWFNVHHSRLSGGMTYKLRLLNQLKITVNCIDLYYVIVLHVIYGR